MSTLIRKARKGNSDASIKRKKYLAYIVSGLLCICLIFITVFGIFSILNNDTYDTKDPAVDTGDDGTAAE